VQGVAGVAGRVEAGPAGGALDDAGDAAVGEAIGGELVVLVDAAEQSASGDSGGIAPGAQRAERAGVGVLAEGDADLVADALLVGLAAAQPQPQAIGGLEGVLGVERAELGAAQAAGETEEEESAVAPPARVSGGAVARSRRSSAVTTAVFWEGAVPRVRRIPAMVVRTRTSVVGEGTWPASWWAWEMAERRRWIVEALAPASARAER
jgi:hypothetical protein